MSRLARRAVIATKGGGGGAKTYAEFVTHITGLAPTAETWLGLASINDGPYRVTTSATGVDGGYGSVWQRVFDSTQIRTLVRHALPSQAVFNAILAAGTQVFWRISEVESEVLTAVNRNGFTTLGDASEVPYACEEFLYWDGTQVQKMNPRAGTGPTPYTW